MRFPRISDVPTESIEQADLRARELSALASPRLSRSEARSVRRSNGTDWLKLARSIQMIFGLNLMKLATKESIDSDFRRLRKK